MKNFNVLCLLIAALLGGCAQNKNLGASARAVVSGMTRLTNPATVAEPVASPAPTPSRSAQSDHIPTRRTPADVPVNASVTNLPKVSCRVVDTDLQASNRLPKTFYSGGCVNGLADGDALAIGRTGHRYEGRFVKGMKDGIGTYQWPDGQKFVGQYRGDKVYFGKMMIPASHRAVNSPAWSGKGAIEENYYVVEGVYIDGVFAYPCHDMVQCDAIVAKRDSTYRAEQFSGEKLWLQMFERAANDPQGYNKLLAELSRDANGPSAAVNGLVMGPKRNDYQKILTDSRLYFLYHRKPSVLVEKIKQCTIERDYTPEEACDCVAGLPGDSAIGPGAGELVLRSNVKLALKACGQAADKAQSSLLKGRYLAQRARAQMATNDQSIGAEWVKAATSLGYGRAAIVLPFADVLELEIRGGGFPPLSTTDVEAIVKRATDRLKATKTAGIRETPIVAEQLRQAAERLKFNSSILNPITSAILRPEPETAAGNGDCALRAISNAAGYGVTNFSQNYGMVCGNR